MMKFKHEKSDKKWILGVTILILLFMFVITFAITIELYNNQDYVIESYEKQEGRLVNQVSQTIKLMKEMGTSDSEIAGYMSTLGASGARFYVVSHDDVIIFAKNDVTTANLGTLSDKYNFYDSLNNQELTILRASFESADGEYEVALVEDTYNIKDELDVTRHFYYILMYSVILCVVVIALLVTLLGFIKDTNEKLDGTQRELFERNEEMEELSMEFSANEGDKTDIEDGVVGNGIVKSDDLEFYNVYTIRMLLEKSAEPELKSVSIIFAGIDMREKYYSKDELFDIMGNFKKGLASKEIIGEVKKGLFVILLYKYTDEEVIAKLSEFGKVCENIYKNNKVVVTLSLVKPDDRLPIERFNSFFDSET